MESFGWFRWNELGVGADEAGKVGRTEHEGPRIPGSGAEWYT